MTADRAWIVYTLSDPRTNAVRYVGVTHQTSTVRLAGHIYAAQRRPGSTHCASWIKSLLALGLRPTMTTIESGAGIGWEEAERRWIAALRERGVALVNHTVGGEGSLGWVPTPATRAKMAAAAARNHTGRTRSDEARQNMSNAQRRRVEWEAANGRKRGAPVLSAATRQRIADAQRGKKRSPEQREQIRAMHRDPNGPYQTAEYKEKQRQALLRRPQEVREAMARNQKGKPKSAATKAKMAAARRAWWARRREES